MGKIVVKAKHLLPLSRALNGVMNRDGSKDAGILDLSPPPSAKGRYVLARLAMAIEKPVETFQNEIMRLLKEHAQKDADDKPVLKVVGDQISAKLVDEEAYKKAVEDIEAEDIELTGVRQVTHAELAPCSLKGWHERALLEAGILEDKEPE